MIKYRALHAVRAARSPPASPERSNQVPDRPVIAIVSLAPDQWLGDTQTLRFIEQVTRDYGNSGRAYKSALIWSIPDAAATLLDEARKLLAWQDIDAEESDRLDETQKHQLHRLRGLRHHQGDCSYRGQAPSDRPDRSVAATPGAPWHPVVGTGPAAEGDELLYQGPGKIRPLGCLDRAGECGCQSAGRAVSAAN